MAYRILKKVKDGGSSLNSLYQFVTEPIDGVTYYKEFDTKAEVDAYVEEELNKGVPKTSLEVVAPMVYTISASIDEEECGWGVPSTNPKPTDKVYQIIACPVGNVVEKGSLITFTIDANRNSFVKLIIDDIEVNTNYYTVVAGSTIITLTELYANTLAVGNHTIKFVFTDGSASSNFSITESSSITDTPSNPSEDNNPGSGTGTDEEPSENSNTGVEGNTGDSTQEGSENEEGSSSENPTEGEGTSPTPESSTEGTENSSETTETESGNEETETSGESEETPTE